MIQALGHVDHKHSQALVCKPSPSTLSSVVLASNFKILVLQSFPRGSLGHHLGHHMPICSQKTRCRRKALSRDLHTQRATLDKQLRAFKRQFRGVVDRTLSRGGDGRLFGPAKAKLNAFDGVGILGKLPTLFCTQRITYNIP